MKKIKIIASALLCFVMCSLTSCLGDTDTTDYSTYDEVAVTAVTLGKLNRYYHKTSSTGADSIVKVTYTASTYPVYVDQIRHLIYNVDSLPYGTDLAHVLTTFTTRSSAIVTIKDVNSDTLRTVSSTDSLDFSQERTLYVYPYNVAVDADNQKYRRTYLMKINAHQEPADTFRWAAMPSMDILKNYSSINVIHSSDNRMYILAHNNSGSDLYQSQSSVSTEDTIFTLENINNGHQYKADAQIVVGDSKTSWFILDNSKLIVANTSIGSPTYDADTIASLIGVADNKLYAISKNRNVVSSADYGNTWKVETIDEDRQFLPTENIGSVIAPLESDDEFNRLTFIGNRSETYNDTTAVVWSKLYSTTTDEEEPFIYQPWVSPNTYKLPRLKNLSVTMYDDDIMALGANKSGKYDHIYISEDHGVTWQEDSRFALPSGFDATSTTMFTFGRYLWVMCAGTGQVWRGRLNNVGWEEHQTVFQSKKKVK